MRAWRNDVLGYSPTAEISNIKSALEKMRNEIISLAAVNRKIRDHRKLGKHKEREDVIIDQITDFYVVFAVSKSGEKITIPFADITVSYDTKRNRPLIELRAI